ncbi:MAG: TetR/AcrR family transcriptional regulator [Gammaproteobacteria bacterium]|jgi:AcrR family transcriptional regulator|nr:MAG: TetR/AcrR family transcriptional regulator [Gammaproteobacteria bacterium]
MIPADPSKSRESKAQPAPGGRVAATRARKESVLKAALECFTEHGIDHTTIQQIQARANCSIGSLYHHFGSKEGIAEELFLAGIQQLNEAMLKEIRSAENAKESVYAVVNAYCDWSTRNRDMARYLHSRDIDFSEEARQRLREIHQAYIREVFTWFAPFVAEGQMRVLPVETYVPLISGATQEYVRRWLSGHHDKQPQEVAGLFAEAAWNAVKS